MKTKWEARSRLRWGSEHQGWFGSLQAAQDFADAEIKRSGGVGRIEAVNRGTRTVYYDVYEELT
jgi:hypothetical protein